MSLTPHQAGSLQDPRATPPAAWQTLHGVTLRPPLMRWDGQAYTGARLVRLDATEASQITGVAAIVQRQNFVGVVASQPQQARRACSLLDAQWQTPIASQAATALDAPDKLTAAPATDFARAYTWQTPDVAVPGHAIASFDGQTLCIWASLQRPDLLRQELARLCQLPDNAIHLFQTEGEDAQDAAVDAALMSQQLRRPVRVESRSDADMHTLRLDWSSQPQNQAVRFLAAGPAALQRRPAVAALLCGLQYPAPTALVLCADTRHEQAPQTRSETQPLMSLEASDAVAAAQVFARESFFDEYWREQGQDPIRARLAELEDDTGRALIESVARQAGWFESSPQAGHGLGFAYSHIVDETQSPPSHVWSAWIADISVDPQRGEVNVNRVTVGHNISAVSDTLSSVQALEDSIRKTATRLLQAPASHDSWGGDVDATSSNLPAHIDIQLAPKPDNLPAAPLCWHRGAELPATAAIANAIHQATGVRLRQAPFDTESLQRQLRTPAPGAGWKRASAWLGGIAAAMGGLVLTAMPWRPAIAPLASLDTSIYSEQAIARGRLVAIAGDCMVCHTAADGPVNAGGHALDTPFGTIYTTNITPDKETGIGTWSYAAFERAMRQGIHQDGRHLYPAFPYTAFAKISDTDMQALYAYLMVQEPVSYRPPETKLSFPYNLRPAMAGWNLLFHDPTPYVPDASQSTLWNRGAYLVQGAGHCAACHSPRNALGAEKEGKHFLAGGLADGWEAPPLNALSKAPIPWTENSLFDYLRTGYSPLHGVAAGPMAPVVHGLSELPDEDVRAMAHYLATLAAPETATASQAQQAALLEQRSRDNEAVMVLPGERLFEGACAVCHDSRDGPPLFGARPSLALNTNLHSDLPDNVIQVLLHGIDHPALPNLGYMPGFKDSMNDQQLEDLLVYMRQRFAPDKPEWKDLPEKIKSLRETPEH